MCKHDNIQPLVAIVPETAKALSRMAISLTCHDCGVRFQFVGVPEGNGERSAGVRDDGRELWVSVMEEMPRRVM
jgi:hypothetical protein